MPLTEQQLPSKIDLLIRNAVIITMDLKNSVIENGFIAITGNQITNIGQDKSIDLSKYDSSTGASHKIPDEVYIKEAQKHQVKTISMITTVEEARDALANGYAISVCSGYGFSSKRESNGIAKKSGGWSHAMCWTASDDTRTVHNETLFLVQNSWGAWNSGPKSHGQPDGSFWIREKDARGMLASKGSWVFSDVDGFPARELPDYGTSTYL